VRRRFEAHGGVVLEFASAAGAVVHPNGVALVLPEQGGRGAAAPAAGAGWRAGPAGSGRRGPEAGAAAASTGNGATVRGPGDAEGGCERGAGPGGAEGRGDTGGVGGTGRITARLLLDSTGNFGPMVRLAHVKATSISSISLSSSSTRA